MLSGANVSGQIASVVAGGVSTRPGARLCCCRTRRPDMIETLKDSLTLMWQGMLSIFLVITLIYLVLKILPNLFKDRS